MSSRRLFRTVLVLALVVLSSRLVIITNAVSGGSHLPAEANSPSIPNYQWQFLSSSEKAVVSASVSAIMSQRIRNITLEIADSSGFPHAGALQVTQTSTEFLNWVGWLEGDWPNYLAMDSSHSRELELDWSVIEPVRGTWDFSGSDWGLKDAIAHGMTDFHIWLGPYFAPCCYSFPDWAKPLEKSALSNATNYQALKDAMRDYVETVVSHFKGRVQLYELWWEANAWYGNGHWPLDRIVDVIKMEALTIRATDPAARISVDLVYEVANELQYLKNSNWRASTVTWTTEYFAQQLCSGAALE